jgi:tol-pal system protein YbgF
MKKLTLVSLAALLISYGSSVYAEDYDQLKALSNKVDDLQKQIYSTNVQDAQSNRMSASMYAQLEEIKDQLKLIRGDVEQLQFDNARINEKLVKFTADVEFRFSSLEKGKQDGKSQDSSILDKIDENLDNEAILANNDSIAKQHTEAKKDDSASSKDKQDFVTRKKNDKGMEATYQDAYSLLKEKKYKQAQEAFAAFVAAYPTSDLTGSAYYWLGETYFLRGEYAKSAVEYLKGYQSNIRGSRASDNLLKLGKSLAKLEKRKEACTTYIKLQKEFPNAQATIKKQMNEDMKALRCKS